MHKELADTRHEQIEELKKLQKKEQANVEIQRQDAGAQLLSSMKVNEAVQDFKQKSATQLSQIEALKERLRVAEQRSLAQVAEGMDLESSIEEANKKILLQASEINDLKKNVRYAHPTTQVSGKATEKEPKGIPSGIQMAQKLQQRGLEQIKALTAARKADKDKIVKLEAQLAEND